MAIRKKWIAISVVVLLGLVGAVIALGIYVDREFEKMQLESPLILEEVNDPPAPIEPDRIDCSSEICSERLVWLRRCYENLLQRQPNAAGEVKAFATVGKSSVITTVDPRTEDFEDERFLNCLRRVLKKMKFSRGTYEEGRVLILPLNFRPL